MPKQCNETSSVTSSSLLSTNSPNDLMSYITQELSDARRAILNHAPSSVRDHSWISPDATKLTIRSTPPQTSQTLTQLSTKSGWLLVQQHNSKSWKKQWCCVVPHTFLYLFDDPLDKSSFSSSNGSNASFNELLTCGNYDYTNIHVTYDEEGRDVINPSRSRLKPNTIIDLEDYTNINHMQTGYVLELSGSESINHERNNALNYENGHNHHQNPKKEKLRSMYFRVKSPEECKEWSDSFQSDRFQSVKNECREIHNLNYNMKLQIEDCVKMIEEEEQKRKKAEMDAYQVRSNAQSMSKNVIQLVRDALEQTLNLEETREMPSMDTDQRNSLLSMFQRISTDPKVKDKFHERLEKKRSQCVQSVNNIISSDEHTTNEATSKTVETLIEFASFLFADLIKVYGDLHQTKEELHKVQHESVDPKAHNALKSKLEHNYKDKRKYVEKCNFLESELAQSRHETNEIQHSLHVKELELQMLPSSFKKRIQELDKHKDLLKNEVLKLRALIGNVETAETTSLLRSSNSMSADDFNGLEGDQSMSDRNFGLPELSPLNMNPIASSIDQNLNYVPKRRHQHRSTSLPPVRMNCDYTQPCSAGPDINFPTQSGLCSSSNRIESYREEIVPILDTVISNESQEMNQDIFSNSFTTLDNSESKDEIFQQLQSADKNEKKWYSSSACTDTRQYASPGSKKKKNRKSASQNKISGKGNKGQQAEISVFDSSTWICGQQNDEMSV